MNKQDYFSTFYWVLFSCADVPNKMTSGSMTESDLEYGQTAALWNVTIKFILKSLWAFVPNPLKFFPHLFDLVLKNTKFQSAHPQIQENFVCQT